MLVPKAAKLTKVPISLGNTYREVLDMLLSQHEDDLNQSVKGDGAGKIQGG